MLLAMAALLAGCKGAQDSSSNEMRAVVHADMNEVMSDIDAAMKNDPAVGMSSNPYDYVGISSAVWPIVTRSQLEILLPPRSADVRLQPKCVLLAGTRWG